MAEQVVGHGSSRALSGEEISAMATKTAMNILGAAKAHDEKLRAEGAAAERARLRECAEERVIHALDMLGAMELWESRKADMAVRIIDAIFGGTP